MKRGSKAGIVCCSNGQPRIKEKDFIELEQALAKAGLVPVFSDFIYDRGTVLAGREKAGALMKFYEDDEVECIFDISGGDLANEVLPFLDYDMIREKEKLFWGYSDLTTVINAIYAQTGKPSVLYQVRNLISDHRESQARDFSDTVMDGKKSLYDFPYEFYQGEYMEGIVVGGNIRCLLKLAGTRYWPDMKGKILLLEARSGKFPQMVTYFSQLSQMGVFEQVEGILLGTFTKMEEDPLQPPVTELAASFAGKSLPVAKTDRIGHGTDSKGIIIGEKLRFEKRLEKM